MASALGVKTPSTPTQQLDREARAQAVRAAMQALTPEERDLLTLRFVDDLKPAEIAIVIGGDVAPNTIAQRLVRLCRRLRTQLERDPAVA
jgi:RNA polymerase sigma factor (sigma-70 family)